MVHMCKVASGIDSQVLGEQEIFGQFKRAQIIARKNESLNRHLLIPVSYTHLRAHET